MGNREAAAAEPTKDPPDTGRLVTQAAAGDREAFTELVRRYHPVVFRWSYAATADRDDADDVSQAVLVRMFNALSTYRYESRITTWLYAITRNILAERLRKASRRGVMLPLEHPEAGAAEDTTPVPDMDQLMLARVVRSHLRHLPPRQREVFELTDLQGFSPAEVAEMIDLEQVTVRTNLLKARRAIRQRMLELDPKLVEELKS
jgi:RNA polymerase sigma-70 factor (ECF subfamily)